MEIVDVLVAALNEVAFNDALHLIVGNFLIILFRHAIVCRAVAGRPRYSLRRSRRRIHHAAGQDIAGNLRKEIIVLRHFKPGNVDLLDQFIIGASHVLPHAGGLIAVGNKQHQRQNHDQRDGDAAPNPAAHLLFLFDLRKDILCPFFISLHG